MAPTDEPAHRTLQHRAEGDDITVREGDAVDGEDGVFEIRMPIASTGEVRNEGDDPLTRRELEGFAEQIAERQVPVFLGHGADSTIADGHYSALGRIGDWRDASYQARSADGDDGVLMATARMPDPDTLPDLGQYRTALGIIKEQATRGIAQDASIGWRTDDSFPGGNDLMEASIVGIGADWRTNTGDDEAAVVARAAADLGVDPDALADRVRSVAAADAEDLTPLDEVGDERESPDEGRPLGPPGDRDRFEDFDECVATLSEDDDMSEADAKTVCGAWENASQAPDSDDARAEELPYPDRAATSTDDTMTDDDAADPDSPDGGTTDDAQDSNRAPDDLTEDRLATFAAAHYDGFDESDVMEAADAADAEFVGAADVEELYDLVSVVVGAEYDAVESAMEDLAGGEQEGDKPDDDEDDDDEDDGGMNQQDGDDADDAGERALEAVNELKEEFREFREGDGDTETPDRGGTDAADSDDTETEADRAADDPTTDGPNWRA